MQYTVLIVLLSLLAVAIQHGFRLSVLMGLFKSTVYNHAPGKCQAVEGVVAGSEDIQVLPNGLAFISVGNKWVPNGTVSGIQLYNLNKPDDAPVLLEMQVPQMSEFDHSSFSPHGLYVWQNEDGNVLVYVVNHHKKLGDCIEKFRFDEKAMKLIHENTFMDSTMILVNDLVVVDEDKFYFTNSMGHSDDLSMVIEFLLMLPWGNVCYFNGKIGRIITAGLFAPNGINISKDKKFLYLAMFGTQELRIYSIQANKELESLQTKALFTSPDNINVAEDGSLWIGCQPLLHQAIKGLLAPSQILRITLDANHNIDRVTEVFSDDGRKISSASVAVYHKGKVLIGSVMQKTILCDVNTLE